MEANKGTRMPRADWDYLSNWEIDTPPLPTQHRIAEILGALDDKIELNLQTNKTLEEMAMALYKHWFVDFGPFKNCEFVDSELGPIPKGWEVKNLSLLSANYDNLRVPISSRERTKIQGRYPYYGATGIMDHINDYKYDGRYILVAEDDTVKNEYDKPFVQFIEGKFWVNNHAHVLKGNGYISDEFLKIAISNIHVIPFITGAVQPKISKTNLEKMKFVIGTENIHESFDLHITPLFDQIFLNKKENIFLTQTRDYLLPKLISGEVNVN